MGKFKIIKMGYSQIEVDNYIEQLINDYETKISEQKDKIFYLTDELNKIKNGSGKDLMNSLVSAVERAKLIENSSKNLYELETKKLNLLYSKMENLLRDENIYNDRSIKQELLYLIKDCRKSLENNISRQDENLSDGIGTGDPVKKLLSKMINFNKAAKEENQLSSSSLVLKQPLSLSQSSYSSFSSEEPRKDDIQPVKVVAVKKQEPKDQTKDKEISVYTQNEFDKFLSKEENLNGANFENIMFSNKQKLNPYVIGADLGDLSPNESGFDLKEAVNPKEDLEDIMKAFDFFNDNNKKKK